MTKQEWVASSDEEQYDGVTRYASREDAIVHGPDELDLEPGQTYWVGRVRSVLDQKDEAIFSGDRLVESLRDFAFEIGGEFAEDWLTDATKEQVAELTRDGAALVRAWIERHGHSPGFFSVEQSSDHVEVEWPESCEREGCKQDVTAVFDAPESAWIFTCADHAEPCRDDLVHVVSGPVKLDDWKIRERRNLLGLSREGS